MRRTYALTLAILFSLYSYGQAPIYGHDAMKKAQILAMETGMTRIKNDILGISMGIGYYDFAHPGYESFTNSTPSKSVIRLEYAGLIKEQNAYADSVLKDTKERAKIEALNVANRSSATMLSWAANEKKITKALNTFKSKISLVTVYGGTPAEKAKWEEYSKMFDFAIKVMKHGYQPDSKRDREFNEIYNDINEKTLSLSRRINMLKALREAVAFSKTKSMSRQRNVTDCLQRSFSAWSDIAKEKK